MNLFAEPDDHAVGRSRGGLSTKIHALVDGKGRPLVLLVAPGQGGDAPMFAHLMNQLKINRAGQGRPRTRPDRVRGDKAYSSRAIRTHLRDRGITAVIPQPSDQIGHRKRRGSTGGRPPAFDKEDYKGRNVVERNFNSTLCVLGFLTQTKWKICPACDARIPWRAKTCPECASSQTISPATRAKLKPGAYPRLKARTIHLPVELDKKLRRIARPLKKRLSMTEEAAMSQYIRKLIERFDKDFDRLDDNPKP